MFCWCWWLYGFWSEFFFIKINLTLSPTLCKNIFRKIFKEFFEKSDKSKVHYLTKKKILLTLEISIHVKNRINEKAFVRCLEPGVIYIFVKGKHYFRCLAEGEKWKLVGNWQIKLLTQKFVSSKNCFHSLNQRKKRQKTYQTYGRKILSIWENAFSRQ